jgi:Adaptor complexes medium subunit family
MYPPYLHISSLTLPPLIEYGSWTCHAISVLTRLTRNTLLNSIQRCVRLGKFDTERTITFIPPDGEFELMRYRVTAPSQPFTLRPTMSEEGKNKLSITLTVSEPEICWLPMLC